jgi:hypothetical protein
MSHRSSARVAALLSALAVALGAAAVCTTPHPAMTVAGVCCAGHT